MRFRHVAFILAGSVAVFVACAAEQAATHSSATDSGVADAVAVPDAKAGPTPPSTTVDVVPCVGGVAEKAYPGRTKEDLARAVTLVCGTTLPDPLPAKGYACYSGNVTVKDGAAASWCPSGVTSVTFVAPPPL